MLIQPSFNAGPSTGATAISFPTQSGGTSPGGLEGLRADWNVRMNISHETGFVGGAGRLLIHNLVVDEKRELILLLPAALQDRPGRLEFATAEVCSAKPGIAATPGQPLAFRTEGAKVVLSLPVLQLNDWLYIDVTWTGGFAQGGLSHPGAQIPVGDFHPQIAAEVTTDTGLPGLAPVAARYDVELGSDLGAVVRFDATAMPIEVASRANPDGTMTMHEFKSYGSSRIDALLAPPGSLPG
ncbi:MAG: hypothetical protein JWO69_1239 [Thermoleophilia bacterium]|jgi:hypothetical protein|nr:hypothetical protein [Thermoleophilia bacterium]